MYFRVCETQRTRMYVTDTTATPNGHQMAVVMWDWSIGPLETNFSEILIKISWQEKIIWNVSCQILAIFFMPQCARYEIFFSYLPPILPEICFYRLQIQSIPSRPLGQHENLGQKVPDVGEDVIQMFCEEWKKVIQTRTT